jgi:hypothetical protein
VTRKRSLENSPIERGRSELRCRSASRYKRFGKGLGHAEGAGHFAGIQVGTEAIIILLGIDEPLKDLLFLMLAFRALHVIQYAVQYSHKRFPRLFLHALAVRHDLGARAALADVSNICTMQKYN